MEEVVITLFENRDVVLPRQDVRIEHVAELEHESEREDQYDQGLMGQLFFVPDEKAVACDEHISQHHDSARCRLAPELHARGDKHHQNKKCRNNKRVLVNYSCDPVLFKTSRHKRL